MPDARTPVIVGVGQTTQRGDDPADALEPIDLLAVAARAAGDDAGAAVLDRVDTIAVVALISWRYPDPGARLAQRLGVEPKTTILTTTGGNSPQMLLNRLADSIQRGKTDVALIGGVECMSSRLRAQREPKVWLDWLKDDSPPCPNVMGDDRPGSSQYEMAHLAAAPVQIYPLFETARRARLGEDVVSHRERVAELWSRFAAVAAENPYAWTPTAWNADEILNPSADNRLVTFPYTKRMCAILEVDQAAAFIVCSYEAARAAGVPDDRMAFPLAGSHAHDHFFFTERESLAESPGIRVAGNDLFRVAGLGVDDVARFDLYSCFPSAVQLAMDALEIGPADPRPLTVTGGLCFAGGPGNNYPSHSVAAMVEACRADPGSIGLVTGLGWYVTKHSMGLLSTTPSNEGFVMADPDGTQAAVDALPRRTPAGGYDGEAVVEATSVVFDRDRQPTIAILSTLTPDGRRALANARDVDVMIDMTEHAWEGRTVRLSTDGDTNEVII